MRDGTKENPFTREDVEKAIREHGGTQELDLSGKEFERGIDLRGINNDQLSGIILKEAVLEECHLEGLQLSHAHFEGAFMSGAHLEDIRASGVHFENTELVGAHLEKARLAAAHLEGAKFFDAHLEEANLVNAFLERTRLSEAHLQGVHLFDAKFSDNTEMASVDWGNYVLGEEKEGEEKGKRHFLGWAEDTYRRLKQWYTNAGVYDIAGEFFFREMEAKRKNLRWLQPQERRWLGWWPLRGQKVRLNIYRWLYGYGERPWRVGAWGGLVLFGLALIYFFFRGVAPYTLTGQAFANSLYYSAVSFTALGYGPWFSASSVRSWVIGVGAAEAIVGVLTIALFLVTFVRKMTR